MAPPNDERGPAGGRAREIFSNLNTDENNGTTPENQVARVLARRHLLRYPIAVIIASEPRLGGEL